MRNREKQISFRVSEEEYLKISSNALNAGYKTPSKYVRALAFKHRVSTPKVDLNGAREIAGELRKIGTNINQIAKKANTTDQIEDISEIKKSLEGIMKWLT